MPLTINHQLNTINKTPSTINHQLSTLKSKKILVTGIAGFIGYHLAKKLLERGDEVVGIDNINNYLIGKILNG